MVKISSPDRILADLLFSLFPWVNLTCLDHDETCVRVRVCIHACMRANTRACVRACVRVRSYRHFEGPQLLEALVDGAGPNVEAGHALRPKGASVLVANVQMSHFPHKSGMSYIPS